jgi:dephospho-CoA kinase
VPAIGITGGIATGKTAFGQLLRELLPEATFFDADRAARDLTTTILRRVRSSSKHSARRFIRPPET